METYSPQRLLVTGGAGFIGANFIQYWCRKYPEHRVVVLDALTYAGNLSNLDPVISHPGLRFVHGDIRDLPLIESLLAEEAIDTIVHFAAESHVDRSIHGPDAFIDTNIGGTHTLLKAARAHWLNGAAGPLPHRFHHVSTDEVYGSLGPDDAPFTETTPFAPNSPYSASKAASDHLVRAYHHTYGLQTSITNCSNNYGPYQFPEKLIPLVMLNALHGKPLPIYGDGLYVRDWLYVDDHSRAIDLCLYRGEPGNTYNIGGHNEWPNIEIVRLVCRLIDDAFKQNSGLARRFPQAPATQGKPSDSLITYVKDRPGHDRRYAIDATFSQQALGYAPAESFETGIRKTLDWYLQNETWWRAVMDGSYRDWIDLQYTP